LAAWHWLDLSLRIAALLGAILVVTGPTVVAPLLRHIRPVRKVASLVKWEGIVIDPIGAVLAVVVFEQTLAHGFDASFAEMLLLLGRTAAIGLIVGVGSALLLVHFVMRYPGLFTNVGRRVVSPFPVGKYSDLT
jgi:NhaP-type Na+/H+ or K+/H+ antiporter